jgi:hypothetical protein
LLRKDLRTWEELLGEICREATSTRVSIAEWDEVVGRVLGIDENHDLLTLRLNIGFLTFPADSLEAKIVRARLKNAVGDVVGVLRTDSASHPIAVRILGRNRGKLDSNGMRGVNMKPQRRTKTFAGELAREKTEVDEYANPDF